MDPLTASRRTARFVEKAAKNTSGRTGNKVDMGRQDQRSGMSHERWTLLWQRRRILPQHRQVQRNGELQSREGPARAGRSRAE